MPSLRLIKSKTEKESGEDPGGQMSFLEHLDELRTRLIRCMAFVLIAAFGCWFLSGYMFRFLEAPVNRALAEAQEHRKVPIAGLNGEVAAIPLSSLHQNDKIKYAFPEQIRLGPVSIPAGTSVTARVDKDSAGVLGLFTDEPLSAGNDILPKDVKLPIDLSTGYDKVRDPNDKLVVTTALEAFALFVKVSLYAAIGLSVPFLLWQIWAFVSPGLYPHERKYVTPFVALSSIFFVLGAATAYYLIFPPAAKYLLGLGSDFRLLLKADDYFDFIILLMLGMGGVSQMPAITYVLSRMGLVTAGWMVRVWRVAIITILIVAAVLSPTNDVPNMLLFAAPMFVLYAISIVVAWICGRKRETA
ncbi:MAG TPA: twin-arginine translocase subunit TatC [Pyrinomonadaceae bacterium]|nr:twin-arginine translocase subunit TatC [Pyrinomonadaceae bacterium]